MNLWQCILYTLYKYIENNCMLYLRTDKQIQLIEYNKRWIVHDNFTDRFSFFLFYALLLINSQHIYIYIFLPIWFGIMLMPYTVYAYISYIALNGCISWQFEKLFRIYQWKWALSFYSIQFYLVIITAFKNEKKNVWITLIFLNEYFMIDNYFSFAIILKLKTTQYNFACHHIVRC